jgi:16S rRNA (uracil1498-N3)-methyltransferase
MDNLFYHSDLKDGLAFDFSEEESRHIRVFRYQQGDQIMATNGNGLLAKVQILSDKKIVKAEVISSETFPKSRNSCSIGIAPTKNQDRLEWFVEKSIEIGIENIYLFVSANSEKPRVNMERLIRVAVAAMKQSQKTFLPVIHDLTELQTIVKSADIQQKFIAHCRTDITRSLLKNTLKPNLSGLILIGPEGDFTQEEIQEAESNGYMGISLGVSRLRTETAALAALLTFDILNQTQQ